MRFISTYAKTPVCSSAGVCLAYGETCWFSGGFSAEFTLGNPFLQGRLQVKYLHWCVWHPNRDKKQTKKNELQVIQRVRRSALRAVWTSSWLFRERESDGGTAKPPWAASSSADVTFLRTWTSGDGRTETYKTWAGRSRPVGGGQAVVKTNGHSLWTTYGWGWDGGWGEKRDPEDTNGQRAPRGLG